MPFEVATVPSFWDGFMRLPNKVQKKIWEFLRDFIEYGSTYPSFKYKGMHGDVDARIREARVDRVYRAIVLNPLKNEPFCMLWVDHHDLALEWPRGRKILVDRNQCVHLLDEQVHTLEASRHGKSRTKLLFSGYSQSDLIEAGVSRVLLPAVQAIETPEDLDALTRLLIEPAADRLQLLYAYESLDEARKHFDDTAPAPPSPVPTVVEARIIEDVDELEQTMTMLGRLSPAQMHKLVRSPLWSGILHLMEPAETPEGTSDSTAPARRTRRLDRVTLDRSQLRFAQSVEAGPRLLKGVAGSGKTLVIVSLAIFKAMQGIPRILITCYNLALTRYITSLLDANLKNPLHRARVEVSSIFQICGNVLGENVHHEGQGQSYYDDLVTRSLKKVRLGEGEYDAVLVDETQDLSPEMLKLVVALARGKKPDVKFAEDTNQNLFERRPANFTWKSVIGMSMRGRTTILRTSRRSTQQICDAADRLAGAPLSHCIEDEDGQMLLLQRDDRTGPEVEEHAFASPGELSDWVLTAVQCLLDDGVPPSEIAVLYTRALKNKGDRESGIPFDCLEKIQEGLGDLVSPVMTATDKLELDILSDTIKMGSVYAFKGLDFQAVFLLDGLGAAGRKGTLLFVGATRAREYLHVLTLGDESTATAPRATEALPAEEVRPDTAPPPATATPPTAKARPAAKASRAKPKAAAAKAPKQPMAPPIRGKKSPKRR